MSRSRRKTPIIGMTTARSEKLWKVYAHRVERRITRVAVRVGDDPPDPKAFGDPWLGPKDGRRWCDRPQHYRK